MQLFVLDVLTQQWCCFAGVHASDVSARESEDSDDWDALVEINARTLIADTSADPDALQVRAHVPSPLATQVLSNIYILVLT